MTPVAVFGLIRSRRCAPGIRRFGEMGINPPERLWLSRHCVQDSRQWGVVADVFSVCVLESRSAGAIWDKRAIESVNDNEGRDTMGRLFEFGRRSMVIW